MTGETELDLRGIVTFLVGVRGVVTVTETVVLDGDATAALSFSGTTLRLAEVF